MPKRKHSFPTISSKRMFRGHGFWQDFGRGFFGTIGNPLGTLISVIKGQNPDWMRANRLRLFDHRRGFIGGILSSLGTSYLKDVLGGGLNALQRKSSVPSNHHSILNYKLHSRPYHLIPNYFDKGLPIYIQHGPYRKNGLADTVLGLMKNPLVKEYGLKAALSAGSYLIPKGLNYLISRNAKKNTSKKKKDNEEEEMVY